MRILPVGAGLPGTWGPPDRQTHERIEILKGFYVGKVAFPVWPPVSPITRQKSLIWVLSPTFSGGRQNRLPENKNFKAFPARTKGNPRRFSLPLPAEVAASGQGSILRPRRRPLGFHLTIPTS